MDHQLESRIQKIKAVFFDIDGTLYNNRTHTVPESAIEALQQAKRHGMLLFVATGRHRLQASDVQDLAGIRFDGWVTLNGQYCYDADGAVVYKKAIAPADVKQLAAYAEGTSTPCLFWEAGRMYINRVDEVVISVHRAIGSPIPEVTDISRAAEREILQMGLYLADDAIPEIVGQLIGCTYTKWITHGVDIIPADGNKWMGAEHMLRHFGLSAEEAMSFGDSDNDLELLACSGVSVAMGNAGARVKAVADHVTDSIDEDGVASAMRRFFCWM